MVSKRPLSQIVGTPAGSEGTDGITSEHHRLAETVFRLANRLRIGCVPRAIALRGLLAQRGYDADVRLGVLVRNGRIFGHAWVTIGDAIVGESDAVTKTFATLPPVALGSYVTRDGIHWLRLAPQESPNFIPRCKENPEGNCAWTLQK